LAVLETSSGKITIDIALDQEDLDDAVDQEEGEAVEEGSHIQVNDPVRPGAICGLLLVGRLRRNQTPSIFPYSAPGGSSDASTDASEEPKNRTHRQCSHDGKHRSVTANS
jgi:hypothetical protein